MSEKQQAQIGEVWRNNDKHRTFTVKSEKSIENIANGDYTKVADFPHQNDDFSYLCGSEYCRCIQ
jgi:hypothetical protein